MPNKKILLSVLLATIGAGAMFYLFQPEAPVVPATDSSRVMSIESYIAQNISLISPEKEQVGGKFYVTKMEASDGVGFVEYEDGHNAYVADFTYETSEQDGITIKSFVTR